MVYPLLLLLTFPLFSYSLTSENCLKTQCVEPNPNYCIQALSNVLNVSPCLAGYQCPDYSQLSDYTTTWKNVSCENYDFKVYQDLCNDVTYTKTQYPGDKCCQNWNCATDSCTNGICDPQAISSYCWSHSVCKAGSYCTDLTSTANGYCTPTLSEGSACTKDYECDVGLGCNQKVCTKLFSIYYSKQADNAKFCISNYLTTNGYCDAVKVYANGKLLSPPYQCRIGHTCTYKSVVYDDVIASEPCLCSGFNSSIGYCPSYMNLAYDMIGSLYEDMQYSESKCGEDRTHISDIATLWGCGSISDDQYNHWVLMNEQFNYWALYQSGVIDNCAKSMGLFDPIYVEDDDSAVYLALASLALFLS